MKETRLFARVCTLFHELLGEPETMADRITLTLLEKTPSGPFWNVKVEGVKTFSLSSDELVINFGPKRPAIKFTNSGMTTICSLCSGEVRYGVQGKVPNWWCTECGHQSISRARRKLPYEE